MAAELITPVDEVTGLPYLIAPRLEPFPTDVPIIADPHHALHPNRDERLNPLDPAKKTLAKAALRSCRLQYVQRDLHNEGPASYHGYYVGPLNDMPESDSEIFSTCIAACTGVLTSKVIDLHAGEPIERPITREEFAFLRTPSSRDEFGYRYVTYRYEPMRDFFREYVKKQSLGHLSSSLIDQFLNSSDEEKKLKIGRFLLANAVAVATDHVREKYSFLRRQNLLHPAVSRTYRDPSPLVLYKLGNDAHRNAFITDELGPQLAVA